MKEEFKNKQAALFTIGQEISGFVLVKEEFIEEADGFARTFEHRKTGARLIYLSTEDDNKVFSIAFKTPSADSTGVAHILEHSVLCGSRKYPVKEPFVELAKGSMNTFLNAMTYPDKTMYPVASTNATDFMNLMDVYLDAVFYPNIYQNPYTFYQEGWHYHIEEEGDAINYNGVVYNEMKGAFSNPEEILQNKIFESLYPDSPYRFESGGDPDVIPDLTYEGFLDFHKKYYHPSNSYIYLYGDGDVRDHLTYLNDQYLAAFDKKEINSTIASQKPFTQRAELTATYGVASDESTDKKAYMALNYVLGETMSFEKGLGFLILAHILLNNNSSPLKEALQELDIAEDISYHYSNSLKQPYFSIVLKNTEQDKKAIFLETVETVLKKLSTDGLDPLAVEAGVNIHEFSHIEGEYGTYPKGLVYIIDMMETWLYGQEATDYLKYKPVFEIIKKEMNQGYFEKMIQEMLLDNPHQSFVTIVPEKNYQEQLDQSIADKLADFKVGLTAEELKDLLAETKTLIEKQNEEDAPEDLEKIPKLALSEIRKDAKTYPLAVSEAFDTKLLFHEGFTGDIAYLKLYFDYSDLDQDELKVLSLMCKFLGSMSTDSKDYRLLNQEIEINTGGLSFGIESYDDFNDFGQYQSFVYAKGKAVKEKIPQMVDLIREILTGTLFKETNLIRDLIREIKSQKETQFLTAGHVVGVQRLQSYYSRTARLFEELGGIEFYRFIADLDLNFYEKFDKLSESLNSVAKKVFLGKRPMISITGSEELKNQVLSALEPYLLSLKAEAFGENSYDLEQQIRNEGFMTAAKIQYVSQGYNFKNLGYDYSGSMLVLKSIISMDYLWNKVRVQGGAYGAFMNIGRTGEVYFGSYRDPKLAKTLEAYRGIVEYLKNLQLSQRELEKYIIGSISNKDVPISVFVKGEVADNFYFSNISQEQQQKERDEILGADLDDLKAFALMLEKILDQNIICVLGSEEAIKKDSDLFTEVRSVK
ncbi:insulinase family protein [Eubacteriaceae bacterium ES2]|nr:insulinase family protein [Eubacteriaceae bacterium ES2]